MSNDVVISVSHHLSMSEGKRECDARARVCARRVEKGGCDR